MKFFYSLILILAAHYAYSAVDPAGWSDNKFELRESLSFGEPASFPLLIYKKGVRPCVIMLEQSFLENSDNIQHPIDPNLLDEPTRIINHTGENFRPCSSEIKADFLSTAAPTKTAFLIHPLVLVGVGYYTVCTLGQIGYDRVAPKLFGLVKTSIEYLGTAICIFPIVGNTFLRWVIHGNNKGGTPFYPLY